MFQSHERAYNLIYAWSFDVYHFDLALTFTYVPIRISKRRKIILYVQIFDKRFFWLIGNVHKKINPLQPGVAYLYPLKTSGNL